MSPTGELEVWMKFKDKHFSHNINWKIAHNEFTTSFLGCWIRVSSPEFWGREVLSEL